MLEKRIPYIDFLKSISLICIILAHVSPPGPVFMMRGFDVVLMIVISAFLGGVAYKRRCDGVNKSTESRNYISYFISRFKRLVIPTWILITVYLVYQILTGDIHGVKYYIASYMLTRYGMGYVWIVLIFLYVALMIPVFCRYRKKTVFGVLVFLYLAYEALYFLGVGVGSKILNCSVFYIIPYGLIAFLGMSYNEFSERCKKGIVFCSFLIFLVFFILYYITTGSIQDVQIAKYPPRAYWISYGIMVSFALMYFCERHHSKLYENKLVKFISVHSLGIYLCHVMVLEFYKLLGLPEFWLLKLVVVFIASVVAVWIWDEVKKKGKACVAGLISLILVASIGVSVVSYKGTFMEVKPVSRVAEANQNTFEGKEELEELMNLNLKYILNDWWNTEKLGVFENNTQIKNKEDYVLTGRKKQLSDESTDSFKNWKSEEYLSIGLNRQSQENSIRPLSHAAYCIATSLRYGYYDESITGVSKEDARNMAVKLIASTAKMHLSNQLLGWGRQWQSPLWAENLGFAAWLLWDDFDKEDQKNIEKMVSREVDYVMHDYDIPYYQDKDGKVLYKGDTKGEEIAWCSKILSLATVMFPDNKHVGEWNEKLEQMLIASTAMQEDIDSDEKVDGIVIGDFLNGSNLNSDGTVYNHNMIHIDYMTTIVEEMAETAAVYSLAGREIPEAASFNINKIYNALINADLGTYDSDKKGYHFYERDENGNPTGNITMPGESDWGGYWYSNCFLTDAYVDVINLDDEIEDRYKASIWEKLHLEKAYEQVNRKNEDGEITGQFFQDGENSFVSGELFQAHNLVEAYVLLNELK